MSSVKIYLFLLILNIVIFADVVTVEVTVETNVDCKVELIPITLDDGTTIDTTITINSTGNLGENLSLPYSVKPLAITNNSSISSKVNIVGADNKIAINISDASNAIVTVYSVKGDIVKKSKLSPKG